MKLITKVATPGQWIKIDGADTYKALPTYVSVGEQKLAAFVDQGNYLIRCPDILGILPLSVDGIYLGDIKIK